MPAHVDHHRLQDGGLGGQAIHHSGVDNLLAPPLPAVVEGLLQAVFLRRDLQAKTIAIDEDYAG